MCIAIGCNAISSIFLTHALNYELNIVPVLGKASRGFNTMYGLLVTRLV